MMSAGQGTEESVAGRMRLRFSGGTAVITAFQPPAFQNAISVSTVEPRSSMIDCTRSTCARRFTST